MTTTEILKKYPGLRRDLLYFWVNRNWVYPDSTRKGSRKEFSEYEAAKVGIMFRLYQENVPSEEAYQRAMEELAQTPPSDSAFPPERDGRISMLVVEDDRRQQKAIMGVLGDRFALQFAGSRQAFEILRKATDFGAIIIDLMIPRTDAEDDLPDRRVGFELVYDLLKAGPSSAGLRSLGVFSTDVSSDRAHLESLGIPFGPKTGFIASLNALVEDMGAMRIAPFGER